MAETTVSLSWLLAQARAHLPALTAQARAPLFARPALILPLPHPVAAHQPLSRPQALGMSPRRLLQSQVRTPWPQATCALLVAYNLAPDGHLVDDVEPTSRWLAFAFSPFPRKADLLVRAGFDAATGLFELNPPTTPFEAVVREAS